MRFEFKMVPGKPITKEPPQHPNPFELLKTGEKQKEIIRGEPILTDAFGRTLYQTPNGQFRAIGDIFNLVANVYQLQNQFVTLAPPPDDDEEDTVPKQKPKRKAGGIIIVPPSVPKWFEICFVLDGDEGERVYKLRLGETLEETILEEIFNCPPGLEPYEWWTNYIAFGIPDAAIVLGWDKDWNPNVFKINYAQEILATLGITSEIINTAKFTYYDNKLYFAHFQSPSLIVVKSLSENFAAETVVNIPYSGKRLSSSLCVWKNFVVYLEDVTSNYRIKIYDFIKKELIVRIDVEYDIYYQFHMVNDNETHACFVWSYYDSATPETKPQHFIILNEDGTYKDIEENGYRGWMGATNEKAYLAYLPIKVTNMNSLLCISAEYGNEYLVIDDYSKLWTKRALEEGKEFDGNFYFDYHGTPVYSIYKTAYGWYLGVSGYKLYHISADLSTIEEIGDYSTLGNGRCGAVILAPEMDGTMFVEELGESGYDVYRSTDFGASWEKILSGYNALYHSLPNPIVPCGNGILYFVSSRAMEVLYSENYGSTWRHLELGTKEDPKDEARLPLYWGYPPGSGIFQWNYVNMFYSKETNTAYLTTIEGDEFWFYVSKDHGVNFGSHSSHVNLFPPEYCPERIVAKSDGTGVQYAVVRESYPVYHTYESFDGGGTWQESTVSSSVIGLYDVPEGLAIVSQISTYLSKDGGHTKQYVRLHPYKPTHIDTYSLTGTPTLMKRIVYTGELLEWVQKTIGQDSSIGKIYNGKFYIDRATFDLSSEEVTKDVLPYADKFLWLGHYLLYSDYQYPIGDVFIVRDMRTGEELTLSTGKEPYFFPEHMMNYYLKLST